MLKIGQEYNEYTNKTILTWNGHRIMTVTGTATKEDLKLAQDLAQDYKASKVKR